jgi:AraC-like DNA-binding protein
MPRCTAPRRYRSRLALVEEGSLRMAPILGAPGLLATMDVDPGAVIAEAGLDAALFEDEENIIPFTDLGRFLALCAAHTGCPHFGLLLGQSAGLDVLGLVGCLARHSPDIGSALRNTILYLHLHDRGAVPTLQVSGDRALIAYTIYRAEVPGTEQIYDCALAIAFNILKSLAGPSWKPTEVRLHRAMPAQIAPYRRVFRTRPHFGADQSAIVFAASWLDRPLGGADALVRQDIMQEIDALDAQGTGDMASQLRRMLRRMLIGGACQSETSLAQVAEIFAIHKRTLNRRLRDQGTSFKELIDETRYDIARQLLRDTRMPVAEVAAALDYSDSAAFDRAFRRWSGTTPSAWRTAHSPL